MSKVIDDALAAGREAAARNAWREALDLLTEAQASGAQLLPEDLDSLGEAAWWSGRLEESLDARERAHAAYVQAGRRIQAAVVALKLCFDYFSKLAQSTAVAWLNRAERLLAGQPESVAHGHLAFAFAHAALVLGDPDGAYEQGSKALDIGVRMGDLDLQALGLMQQGRALIAKGEVSQGLALVDEATVAAVSGGLAPYSTGTIYCLSVMACNDLGEYRRADEWSQAAYRWCERQANASGFPGSCRIHRAEILRLRGAWVEAEQEARRATAELQNFNLSVAGQGFYEIGEIRLRMGDIPGAEQVFRQAHEFGKEPQPGLALLRLAEGKAQAALALLRNALEDQANLPAQPAGGSPSMRLRRGRILGPMVEVALAAGDLSTARSASEELQVIADDYKTAALLASAAFAGGSLKLAEKDPSNALQMLRQSRDLWLQANSPYEVGRVRLLLAAAYRALGDEEAAILEAQTARSVFEQLGAVFELRRADEMLGADAVADLRRLPRTGPRFTKTFMFTDMVKSTNLIEVIGDEGWESLLRWHDETLRSLFSKYDGEEINKVGDGFLVAFEQPNAAVECAVAIQRKLSDHRKTHGFAPHIRIGIHKTEATRRGRDYLGKGIHQAARIGAMAEAGEIVISAETLDRQPARFPLSEPRAVELKGISRRVEVVTLDWR
jgi:class 3 adenylate cyclase